MSSQPNYRGYRFPPEIISHTVWLYHRFTLSLRDIEDLLAERNVIVSYESIRQWWATFGFDCAVGRHLLRAANYRILRGRAFVAWQEVTCFQ
jgi:transposase-like protein